MITILENAILQARIKNTGAEICSIKKKDSSLEYIWNADPNIWARHAPLLFPIVGGLVNNSYKLGGIRYRLARHGFARDCEFEKLNSNSTEAVYSLTSSRETRLSYPYKFVLITKYKLENNKLIITYELENKSKDEMYFSLGGHPAFNCPLTKGEKRSDYKIVFNKNETSNTQIIEDGLRTGERIPILRNSNEIQITDNLFDRDALIFDDLKSDTVTLQKGNEKFVSLNFKEFKYLGIWSKDKNSTFICFEPWQGITDAINHDQELINKEGILSLGIGEQISFSYSIIIH